MSDLAEGEDWRYWVWKDLEAICPRWIKPCCCQSQVSAQQERKWRAEARHGRQTGSVDKEGLMPGRAEAACLGRQQLPEQSSEQGPGRAGGWLPSVFRSTSLGNWAESVFYKEERQ